MAHVDKEAAKIRGDCSCLGPNGRTANSTSLANCLTSYMQKYLYHWEFASLHQQMQSWEYWGGGGGGGSMSLSKHEVKKQPLILCL